MEFFKNIYNHYKWSQNLRRENDKEFLMSSKFNFSDKYASTCNLLHFIAITVNIIANCSETMKKDWSVLDRHAFLSLCNGFWALIPQKSIHKVKCQQKKWICVRIWGHGKLKVFSLDRNPQVGRLFFQDFPPSLWWSLADLDLKMISIFSRWRTRSKSL